MMTEGDPLSCSRDSEDSPMTARARRRDLGVAVQACRRRLHAGTDHFHQTPHVAAMVHGGSDLRTI